MRYSTVYYYTSLFLQRLSLVGGAQRHCCATMSSRAARPQTAARLQNQPAGDADRTPIATVSVAPSGAAMAPR